MVVAEGLANEAMRERGEGEIDLAKEDGKWRDDGVPYIKYENV